MLIVGDDERNVVDFVDLPWDGDRTLVTLTSKIIYTEVSHIYMENGRECVERHAHRRGRRAQVL